MAVPKTCDYVEEMSQAILSAFESNFANINSCLRMSVDISSRPTSAPSSYSNPYQCNTVEPSGFPIGAKPRNPCQNDTRLDTLKVDIKLKDRVKRYEAAV